MALTRSYAAGREQCFQQIEKLINSHSLRGSESLCKLLRYLAEHSLDHPGVALKEYQIATEVLGRSDGFDPQSDSTVRVQAGRLRMKLADYYSHEGPDDPVVVELPKGSYALTFHVRTPPITLTEAPPGRERGIQKATRAAFETWLDDRGCGALGSAGGGAVDLRPTACKSQHGRNQFQPFIRSFGTASSRGRSRRG